nr:MAG TPA: hypothetical protein [Caudoviricetes sp.]
MRLNLLKRQQTYFLLIFAKKIPAKISKSPRQFPHQNPKNIGK